MKNMNRISKGCRISVKYNARKLLIDRFRVIKWSKIYVDRESIKD